MIPKFIQNVSPKLFPFFATVFIYFIILQIGMENKFLKAIFKCLPVYSLIYFLFAEKSTEDKQRNYKLMILIGLVASSIGDAFLVWPDKFIPGMVAFGIAHLFYIKAFGFTPLFIKHGIVLYSLCCFVVQLLIEKIDGILMYAIPVYGYILVTMCWRSICLLVNSKGETIWERSFVTLGGVSWMISDAVLGFDKFRKPVPYAQLIVMSTYYFGQLGVTLSVSNCYKK